MEGQAVVDLDHEKYYNGGKGNLEHVMRDPAKAEQALARAYDLTPKDPKVILALAESVAANNDNSLIGRPAELISEAMAADPDNPTARWLAGMAAFQQGQFNTAATAWKQVLGQLDPNGDEAAEMRTLIAEAERRAGVPVGTAMVAEAAADEAAAAIAPRVDPGTAAGDETAPAPSAPAGPTASDGAPAARSDGSASAGTDQPGNRTPPSSAASGPAADAAAPGIKVSIALAPALAEQTTPETTVFVFAKAANGPPMPLAVQRLQVKDLPTTLRLDDSMAMMPAMSLSRFPRVIVGARVSAGGQAMPQPGDLEGESDPVSSRGGAPVEIVIDTVRPDRGG
jgi:cytochrome c-type biogenesis protein CcmH